jgi:4-amino-4-deoxy-L-arabinose transferase-like glycosyltransferase
VSAPTTPDLTPRPRTLLLAVLAWHLVFWVLAPWLVYRMLPLDALELLGWGQEWQWGYYKHPPLGPWLGEAFVWLCGGRIESLYLLAQLALVVTLIYVWRCARLFLDPARAVLATVLLEGSYFHTYLIPNFNMNSLQLPLWAGFSYHLLRAMKGQRAHWYACGALAALCLLAKYSGALLLLSGAALVLATGEGRRALRTPHPWLAVLLALALLAPHLNWLAAHYELPLQYLRSFDPSGATPWWAHAVEPLRFALGAALSLLFSALLLLLLRERGARREWPRETLWLLVLCLGPLLLAMAYGAVSGSRLKATWAFPFFNLAGVVALVLLPTRIDARRWQRFAIALGGTMLLTAGIHLAYKLGSDRSKTAFDGNALAQAIAKDWESEYATPLRVVVGDHVLSAIVSSYAPTRPAMLVRGDYTVSLWLTPEDVARDGAAVVCRSAEPCYPDLAERGATLRQLRVDDQDLRYFFLPPRPTPL